MPSREPRNSAFQSVLGFISKITLTGLLTCAFVLYLMYSLWSMYYVYFPPSCPRADKCLHPSWSKATRFHVTAFVSSKKEPKSASQVKAIWSQSNFDIGTATSVHLNVTVPRETSRNGSLYLHLYLTDETNAKQKFSLSSPSHYALGHTSRSTASVTKFVVLKTKAFNLLESPVETTKSSKPVTHWIPQLTIHLMAEPLSLYSLSNEMLPHFRLNDQRKYLPMIYIDHLGSLQKDFIPVQSNSTTMPLTLTYTPVSYGKMRLIFLVDNSLKMLEKAGFSEKDTDDVKAVFFDTNIYLLFLTFIVSGFHLLFDMLAFKNDIVFWRHRKTNVGLSFRSLVWRSASQAIIFMYLYDQGTSMIVIGPAGVSVLIEFWKVTKALKLKLVRFGWCVRFQFGQTTEEEKQSDAYDSEGMKYLSWLVLPCCLAYSTYSLIFVPHTGWFSWCIENIVNGVYLFGFVFMLPQLFVNYRLKSVAHLPWKAFMYKAFNTVVDDLFAFIITMPTSHRVACFRDDVVFLIYLYQRWLYPVDSKRPTEYGAISNEDKAKNE